MRNKEILVFITLFFIIIALANTLFLINKTNKIIEAQRISGKSTGVVKFCINHLPEIDVSPCPTLTYTEMEYTCQVGVTDEDVGIADQSLTFTSQFLVGTKLFDVSTNGSINFTPSDGQQGNYTILVRVTDDSGCENNEDQDRFNLEIIRLVCVNNTRPILNLSICSKVAYQNSTYTCQVEAYDPDILAGSLTFSSDLLNRTNWFNITSGGLINFTANNSQVGYYEIKVTVDDNTGCSDGIAIGILNLTVYNINDPPEFHGPIPNQTWEQDVSLVAFDLDNYFIDIDRDPLTYSNSILNNIKVEINEFNVVKFTPIPGWFGSEYITFFAHDPSNAYAQSNDIKLTVLPEEMILTTQSGGLGGTGGFSKCIPEWYCYEWRECSSEGYQTRECVDLHACGTLLYRPNVTQACVYIGTCYDEVKNHGEEGIDCGGLCPPCPTCDDGIRNGDETGVDCGGSCPLCPGCDNKIKDSFEEGVDCGGPCLPCSTCSDSIKNCHLIIQDNGSVKKVCEVGVDCGGPCESCSEIEVPGYFQDRNRLLTLIMVILILLLSIFIITYKYTHEYIKKLLAKLGIYFASRKARYEEERLLSLSFADKIIEKLDKLERQLPSKKTTKELSVEFSKIVREYFRDILSLEYEFTYEELLAELQKKRLDPMLEKILIPFFKKAIQSEYGGVNLRRRELHSLIDEAKEIVHLTSQEKPKEKINLEKIPKNKLEIDKVYIAVSNIEKLLEFDEVKKATKLYIKTLDAYNNLPEREKDAVYPHLTRLYSEMKLAARRR